MAAAAAEIAYGVPVNLTLGDEVFVDLGAENRDGKPVVMLALDDGEGAAALELSAEQAELLADVLRGLAGAAVQLGG
jgi:D-aminopeptidase